MRLLAITVTLLVSLVARAAPALEFFSERTRVHAGTNTSVFLSNASEEAAFDVEVRLEWSEGLALFNDSFRPNLHIWQCSVEARSAVCRTAELGPGLFDGFFFTLIATDAAGGHRSAMATLAARDTAPQTVVFDVIAAHSARITSGVDFGPGSLRAAIDEINANPLCGTDVPCTIEIGGLFDEPVEIAPATPLPPIRKCNVWISGPDQLEFPLAVKRAAISGRNAAYGNGLEIRASCAAGLSGVSIRSIVIHSWPWNGIHFEAPAPHAEGSYPHSIERVYVGTDTAGLLARPNRSRGINVDSPYERVLIGSSIVSGNGRSGISAWRGQSVYVYGTGMGVDRNGNALGNGASGFFSLGVPFQIVQSTIAHNAHFGVAAAPVTTGEAQITHNVIHSNAGLPIDWNLDGRTLPDDESDRVLNAPQLLEAVYDEATGHTTVRGVVRLTAGAFGGSFGLYFYRAASERGDVIGMLSYPPQGVPAPQHGTEDVPFELTIAGIERGTLLSAQTVAGSVSPTMSSEISAAVPVR